MIAFTFLLFLQTGGIRIDIFELAGSARGKGMGDAYISSCFDGSAPFYNPAAIWEVKGFRILYMHSELAFENYFDNLTFVKSPFALSYLRLSSINIPYIVLKDTNVMDTTNIYIENINYLSHSLVLSLSFPVFLLNAGINLKIWEEKAKDFKNNMVLMDIAFIKIFNKLSTGFVMRDIKFKEGVNSYVSTGITFFILDELNFSILVDRFLNSNIYEMKLGTEWNFSKFFKIRAGYNGESFVIGAGILTKYMEVDYAFVMHTDIPSSHRISIELFF